MEWIPLLLANGSEPFSFRFVLQPLLAIALGIRDGRRDRREGRPPYALSLVMDHLGRSAALREALRAIALPLVIAILLDGLVQVMVSQRVLVWHALVVGVTLVGLPYILSRGAANRLSAPPPRRHPV